MELTHSRLLPADRETVWRALNDPERLRAAIPGCESIEETGEGEYRVMVVAAVGPVRAKFVGRLRLCDVVPPRSYTLTFEGQGGAAGFAKGSASVTLTEVPGGTQLDDQVSAQVGGRLAQVGQRLIDAAAGKLADDFFAAFSSSLAAGPGIVSNGASPPAGRASGAPLWFAAALIALLFALVFALR